MPTVIFHLTVGSYLADCTCWALYASLCDCDNLSPPGLPPFIRYGSRLPNPRCHTACGSFPSLARFNPGQDVGSHPRHILLLSKWACEVTCEPSRILLENWGRNTHCLCTHRWVRFEGDYLAVRQCELGMFAKQPTTGKFGQPQCSTRKMRPS